jgi:Arc/MetJ-type ribon-helix-helix transcriptional regulator
MSFLHTHIKLARRERMPSRFLTEMEEMVKRKTDSEYIDVTTTVRLDKETDKRLKSTVKDLDVSQSTFVRQAIRDAIAAAGVV